MNSRTIFVVSLICCCIYQATAIECIKCTSEEDTRCGNESSVFADITCEPFQDSCYLIVTRQQIAHNGPQDRLKDNDDFEIVSRGCATKHDFRGFASIDKCMTETVGGGGSQTHCLCSGNLCNSATSISAGITLLFTLFFLKLVV
ncbi:uncharacterized protein [Watersipora subatra]|uniref:uncharacterized protein n=1 Tax=Watersipora subatra TaxID=2589382 RepID=UPI00355C9E50